MEEMTVFVKEAVDHNHVQTLENSLIQLSGVERALVDVNNGEVIIEFNEDTLSIETIRDMIKQQGFHIKE